MVKKIKQVCVYCASSPSVDGKYFDVAARLGDALAVQGIRLIYGGGAIGLMGKIADQMLSHGAEVIGVMPQFMDAVELGHKGVALEIVADMHRRKARFFQGTDAIVAMAGGCGTLEELFEALTWKRLGLITCPIIILNTNGFFDPILEMLERSVEQKFMNAKHKEMWMVVTQPEEVIAAIEQSPNWSQEHFKYAVVDHPNFSDQ